MLSTVIMNDSDELSYKMEFSTELAKKKLVLYELFMSLVAVLSSW